MPGKIITLKSNHSVTGGIYFLKSSLLSPQPPLVKEGILYPSLNGNELKAIKLE